MDRRNLISFFFIALLLYILGNVLYIFSPFLQPIFWGAILAFAFYPVYEKISLRLNNRMAGAILTTLLILMTFVPLIILILFLSAKESVHVYGWLSAEFEHGGIQSWLLGIEQHPMVQKIAGSHLLPIHEIRGQWQDWVLSSARWLGNFAITNAASFTKNLVTGIFNFFLTFFLLFFFLYDGAQIHRFIYDITPLDEHNKQEIFQQLSETFSATLRGQLFTALAQAVTLGLVFWALALPLPFFFAALTFLAAMIPIFGASTIWAPFAIYLALTHQWGKFALLMALGTLVISMIDNVLKPILIGHKAKLPYSLLFLGILGGIQVYGFMGIFLAPACLSLFFVLIKIFQEKFFAEHA